MSDHEDIGHCTECRSDQPDSYTIRMLQKGWDQFPCKFCGGVAVLLNKANKEQAMKIHLRQRGLL